MAIHREDAGGVTSRLEGWEWYFIIYQAREFLKYILLKKERAQIFLT